MITFIRWRFNFVMGSLIVAAMVVVGWYAIQIFAKDAQQGGRSWAAVERGSILDRNGKILASQLSLYDVYAWPSNDNEQNQELAMELAPIIGMEAADIHSRLGAANGREFLLKRQVSMDVMETIRDERNHNRLKGVLTRETEIRSYPEKNLASRVIGFTGSDNIGREGVEYVFNKELSENNNVMLTLDSNVQHILEKIADSTLSETQAESVMFLAMDPRNGDILGSVVLPNFDPNRYNTFSSDLYLNLTATEQYEPGSVFKVFSIAALMDAGVISETSEFICNGVYEKVFPSGDRIRIECADGHAHGRVGPREIIINSCNVGTAYAAERIDNQSFYQAMLHFGFGSKTGAWLNSSSSKSTLMETAGLLKDPGTPGLWSGRTRQTIAFGQEVAVSALQVIQAASIIANDGVLVPPRIISQIVSPDGTVISAGENNRNARRQVIRPETARRMLSYMADTAAEIGTGWRANVGDLNLAVKTGTSQIWSTTSNRSQAGGVYSKTDFIASCLAILPMEAPSLIIYAVIVKPRGETYGGRIAAPAIRQAAEQLIDYLGIPRGRNPVVEHSGSMNFPEKTLPALGTRVPDYSGLSKKTLLPLLLQNDVRVEVFGEGWVVRQTPPPGTAITSDTVIELILE